MGRKLIGLSVGFLLTISIAFFMIPAEYNSIILWLAPYFGPWLRFLLMYVFLIFANPIHFVTNIGIWAVIGIITGLFVRSIWGAIPVVIFIFGLAFLMLIIGLVAMIIPLLLSGGGGLDPVGMLSNIPPNVSLFDILGAPVIGPLIDSLTGGIGDLIGGGTPDPNAFLGLIQGFIVNTIILPAVLNFIILLVTAMIGGFIGRLLIPVHD
ncbi:MAG: hypothetical protein ACFFDU_01090 [Candidatus Thorarchaeota archaeon]